MPLYPMPPIFGTRQASVRDELYIYQFKLYNIVMFGSLQNIMTRVGKRQRLVIFIEGDWYKWKTIENSSWALV
jgi:hypothetical protein